MRVLRIVGTSIWTLLLFACLTRAHAESGDEPIDSSTTPARTELETYASICGEADEFEFQITEHLQQPLKQVPIRIVLHGSMSDQCVVELSQHDGELIISIKPVRPG